MKKFALAMVLFAMSTAVFAQKKDILVINEYGTCEIVREVEGSDAADVYKKFKAWLGACNMVWNAIPNGDVVNEKLDFTAAFNTKRVYNPFAGWFQQDLSLDGHITINGNKGVLKINNLRIRESYAGYGAKIEESSIEDKINLYNKYNDILKNGPDPTLSKKDQKDQKKAAKEEIEDLNEMLEKAGEELGGRLDKLATIF